MEAVVTNHEGPTSKLCTVRLALLNKPLKRTAACGVRR